MITQEQRDWLAVEVMGWGKVSEWGNGTPMSGTGYIANDIQQIVLDWQPDTNIEQAFMLLDKGCDYTISKTEGISNGEIYNGVSINDDITEFAETIPLAICKAVLKASGYKESEQ